MKAREQEIAKRPAQPQLVSLNSQLLQLSIDVTELEARLEYVLERFEKVRGATALLDEFEMLTRVEIPDAFDRIRKAESYAEERGGTYATTRRGAQEAGTQRA